MKKIVIVVVILIILGSGGWYVKDNYKKWSWFQVISPGGKKFQKQESKLERYDFDSLRKRGGIASEIKDEGEPADVNVRRLNAIKLTLPRSKQKQAQKILSENTTWTSRIISFQSNGKKITGMMNIPKTVMSNKMPVVIMIRGYADSSGYYSGSGTWKVADELAKSGFVTVSIDFLGFGGSDNESIDTLEARFEKVESVLDLIASVKNLDYIDPNKIGIWAHSNGGQIALSVLEVSGEYHPTTMWAPMTNPFPNSVLETADSGPAGDAIRKLINDFTKQYDSRRYAFENYYSWVNAPVLIHQGTADEWCEIEWQQDVVNKLKLLGKQASLYIYQGDDHNLKNNWNLAVARDISFFTSVLR